MSHIQLDECKYTEAQMSQKAMLQDELVTIRARICDVSAVSLHYLKYSATIIMATLCDILSVMPLMVHCLCVL